jgi:hypothetical protein
LTQARRYVAEAARADDFGTAHGIDEASAWNEERLLRRLSALR